MKCKQAKGSITLFAAMTFMLVTQCIFTILEGARMIEMDKVATLNADAGIESVFAEYCIPLWENYHLLACDLANESGKTDLDAITERLAGITTTNFACGKTLLGSPHMNLLQINQKNIDYDSYTLLTDGQGCVYEAAVSAYMKQNLPYEAVKKMKDYYDEMKGVNDNDTYNSNNIGDALASLEDAKKGAAEAEKAAEPAKISATEKEPNSTRTSSATIKSRSKAHTLAVESTTTEKTVQELEPPKENPLEIVEEVQASGVLGMVLPSGTKVSSKSVEGKDIVSKRNREVGYNPKTPDVNLTDKALVEQYLVGYMSNYVEPKKGHALKYEQEYILVGKSTDEANLRGTVDRILATREAANFAYLFTDGEKMSEAEMMAWAIAGATANPAVVEAVKIGLLTSWAFCESVLDLRTLLSGERIPIVKTSATWTSSLSNIGSLLSGYTKAKSSSVGLNYTDYVGTMIMLLSVSSLAYRAMDLQELTIRKNEGYSNFRMDQALCDMEITVNYEYDSLFFNKVSLISKIIPPYEIPMQTSYTYYKW